MAEDMILKGIGVLGLSLLLIDFGWTVWKRRKKALAQRLIVYILDPNHPINKR